MNDSVSILVAVFLILIALRWMLGKHICSLPIHLVDANEMFFQLGGNQANQQQQQGARRTTVRRMQHRVTPQMVMSILQYLLI